MPSFFMPADISRMPLFYSLPTLMNRAADSFPRSYKDEYSVRYHSENTKLSIDAPPEE